MSNKNSTLKVVTGAVFALALLVGSVANAAITSQLKQGSRNSQVMELQQFLNNCSAETMVASTGPGSKGMETSYFGPATKRAVIAFQNKFGVTTTSYSAGLVGPATRAAIMAGCGTNNNNNNNNNNNSQTGPVTAMLATTNPASGTLISGQAAAKLAEFTFTGNGTVNSVTLARTGVSDQSTLSNVYLYDGATRLSDGYTFNNTGVLTMNNVNLMVSGSKTLTVKADVCSSSICTSISGQTIGVMMTGFTTTGSAMTSVSLSGNTMAVANGTGLLATAALTVASPSPAATSVNAGVTNQTIWSNSLTIGLHASKLYGATFKMIGSAPSNTLANVTLYIDGVMAGKSMINSNSQFVFDTSMNPVALSTGTHTIEVRGDIVGGAYRNFYLSLEKSAELMIMDGQLNNGTVSVTPTYSSNPVSNMLGGLVTVNNGTLTITQDTSFNNVTTLVGGSTFTKMAAYKFTAYGEDVKVNSLSFTPTLTLTTPASPDSLVNVGLYVNGGQVGSSQTATTATTLTFSSLGSNLIIPSGTSVIVEIRGDVVNGGNINVTAGTVKFDLDAVSSNAQGITSGQLTSTASAGGQTLTIGSASATFAQTSGWAANTIAPNQSNQKIGTFTIQTGSAEGIVLNNVLVGITGTMITNNQITNIKVMDGATVLGTPVGNPTASNNFSTSLSIPVSTTKTLDVYADIGSSAATYTVIPAMTITYRGATSNVTTTSSAVTGSTITANVATIVAGGVTFVPSSSPVAQFVIGGSTNMAIGKFNIKSNNSIGGAVVKDVTITVPANTIGTVTVNGVPGTVVGTTATVYNVNVTVPSDASGIDVPVTVSLVCVNPAGACSGVSNSSVTAQITTLTYNDGLAIQTISPTAITATHKLVASKPTVSLTGSSTNGFVTGNQQIGTFTIAADAAGDIKLEAIPVTVSISGAATITAGTIELRDSTGNTVIVGTGGVNGSAGLSASGTFAFNTSFRTISKGTSETFTVWATFAGVTGGSNTMNETFGLGAKASFLWSDVIGGGANITGAQLNTYPTATQTKSN